MIYRSVVPAKSGPITAASEILAPACARKTAERAELGLSGACNWYRVG